MRRSRPRLLALVAALATGGVGTPLAAARAADAPSTGAPARQPKLTPSFLWSLVGAWDVIATGPLGESHARSTSAPGLGETVRLDDGSGEAFGAVYHGHGIYNVSSDERTVVCWWFDAYTAGPLKMIGPLTEASAELSGSGPFGVGTSSWKAVDGGVDGTMSTDGASVIHQAYRKPPK